MTLPTPSPHPWYFAAERPVGRHDDLLFTKQGAFVTAIAFYAEHVLRAILSVEPHPGAVFGFFARWGSGKSSAMEYLIELSVSRLQDTFRSPLTRLATPPGVGLGTSPDQADVDPVGSEQVHPLLTWTRFRSHLAAAAGRPARPELLRKVFAGLPPAAQIELAKAIGFEPGNPASLAFSSEEFLIKRLLELAEIVEVEEMIATRFRRSRLHASATSSISASASHVHLVLVDDLDRTDLKYTSDVLTALDFWVNVPNIFFVVAADRTHLEAAAVNASSDPSHYPGEALEKYIHFTVEVPLLLNSPRDVASYWASLLPDTLASQAGLERFRALLREVAAGAPSHAFTILMPLLWPTKTGTGRGPTPRQAKYNYNRAVAEFARSAASAPPASESFGKSIIGPLVWPEAWEQYVAPAFVQADFGRGTIRESPQLARLRSVLDIARDVIADVGGSRATQQVSDWLSLAVIPFQRALDERGIDLGVCPLDMILYLARDPTIALPSPSGRIGNEKSEQMRNTIDFIPEFAPTEAELRELRSIADQLERVARGRDASQARVLFDELDKKVGDVGPVPGLVASVGNAALYMQAVDPSLAWMLHRLAVSLDPNNAKIRLNLVHFLLERGGHDMLPVALEHLDWVASHEPAFDQERQRLLRNQARFKSGDMDALDDVFLSAQTDQKSNSLAGTVQLLEAGHIDRATEVVRSRLATPVGGDDDQFRFLLLKGVADKLLDDSDPHEAEGLSILGHLLTVAYPRDDEDYVATANNLAVIAQSRRHVDAAMSLWRFAYERGPEHPTLQAAYAGALIEVGDEANAESVRRGLRVSIPIPNEAETLGACAAMWDDVDAVTSDKWWERFRPEVPGLGLRLRRGQ